MKNKILFGVSVLFGLMFINSGLNKLFHYIPMPATMPEETMKDFGAMMEISWLMPLIAIAEIIGGILIIVPKTRAFGAIIIFPIMVGVMLFHTLVDRANLPIAIVLLAMQGWIMFENRQKYMPMIS
ncbi:MAG: hypothetical protein RL708_358 [Bacteroidota bacterium]|jgi:uncharacterized membrane protein YphA (DoxX/SURF4 family)